MFLTGILKAIGTGAKAVGKAVGKAGKVVGKSVYGIVKTQLSGIGAIAPGQAQTTEDIQYTEAGSQTPLSFLPASTTPQPKSVLSSITSQLTDFVNGLHPTVNTNVSVDPSQQNQLLKYAAIGVAAFVLLPKLFPSKRRY